MSVSKIIVKTHAGNMIELTGACVLSSSTPIKWAVDNGVAELSVAPQENIFAQACATALAQRYVSTLNNISGGEDGCIWILPDRCMSVRPVKASTKLQKTIPSDQNTSYAWEYTQQDWGTGLTIYDVCPACRKCTDVAIIKRRFEWVKMMLNMFKDVNINLDPTGGTDTIYALRQQYLSSNRLELSSSCTNEIGDTASKYDEIPLMKGSPLMNEYITTVHMWNFAVSRNNTSTEIHPTEESSAGFYVQTKHALPSCDGQLQLSCDIRVEPNTISSVEPGLSMLVTGKETMFEPFDVDAGTSGVSSDMATLTEESYVVKNVHVDFPAARVAGTYVLVTKFIPFIQTTLLGDDGNPIPMRGSSLWSVPESTATSSVVTSEATTTLSITTVQVGGSVTSQTSSVNPTEADYAQAGEFPSHADNGFNIWKITVTWKLFKRTGSSYSEFKEYVSTYIFTACRTRKPISGLIRDTIWVDKTITSNENAQQL